MSASGTMRRSGQCHRRRQRRVRQPSSTSAQTRRSRSSCSCPERAQPVGISYEVATSPDACSSTRASQMECVPSSSRPLVPSDEFRIQDTMASSTVMLQPRRTALKAVCVLPLRNMSRKDILAAYELLGIEAVVSIRPRLDNKSEPTGTAGEHRALEET